MSTSEMMEREKLRRFTLPLFLVGKAVEFSGRPEDGLRPLPPRSRAGDHFCERDLHLLGQHFNGSRTQVRGTFQVTLHRGCWDT